MSESIVTALTSYRRARSLIELRFSAGTVWQQGFRFALSGGLVALIYAGTTTLLHDGLGLPFQVALAIGFAMSVSVHFTLQRLFVWRAADTAFALSTDRQARRYLLMVGLQYLVTALATSRLPDLVGEPVEVVYLTTISALAIVNFVIFRARIFHPRAAELEGTDELLA